MWKNRAAYSLAVGGLLSLLTAGLLFLVAQDRMTPEVNQILVLIAGMTTVAALTAFQQSVENNTSPSFVDVSFNETLVSQSLSEGIKVTDSSSVDQEKIVEPWDLSLGQLLGLDNSLALAKLRMELERELRHIAYNNQTDISSRPLGVTSMAEELVYREILPATWLGPLKEITHVCNHAIHGETEISDDIAASVVRVGSQLLEQLRSVRNNGGTS
ncbi:hypothetical protein F4X33_09105 [Candidatus Poribacteria bacterium]|nr:hypothetical protein [Candidatus Poribacteria bacterium]